MAPLDPNVFIDPLDLSAWTNPPGGIDPGFTQDVIDTLGSAGSPADGFDQAAAEVAGIVNTLDAVTAEQDTVLDAILAQHQASDPGQLDNSIQGYVSSFDAGNAIVAKGDGLGPPDLLELPMSSSLGLVGAQEPPIQRSYDFGTVAVGSAPLRFHLGQYYWEPHHAIYYSAQQVSGDRDIFGIVTVDNSARNRNPTQIDYYERMTPAKAGSFVAQVNSFGREAAPVIITFTVTITP